MKLTLFVFSVFCIFGAKSGFATHSDLLQKRLENEIKDKTYKKRTCVVSLHNDPKLNAEIKNSARNTLSQMGYEFLSDPAELFEWVEEPGALGIAQCLEGDYEDITIISHTTLNEDGSAPLVFHDGTGPQAQVYPMDRAFWARYTPDGEGIFNEEDETFVPESISSSLRQITLVNCHSELFIHSEHYFRNFLLHHGIHVKIIGEDPFLSMALGQRDLRDVRDAGPVIAENAQPEFMDQIFCLLHEKVWMLVGERGESTCLRNRWKLELDGFALGKKKGTRWIQFSQRSPKRQFQGPSFEMGIKRGMQWGVFKESSLKQTGTYGGALSFLRSVSIKKVNSNHWPTPPDFDWKKRQINTDLLRKNKRKEKYLKALEKCRPHIEHLKTPKEALSWIESHSETKKDCRSFKRYLKKSQKRDKKQEEQKETLSYKEFEKFDERIKKIDNELKKEKYQPRTCLISQLNQNENSLVLSQTREVLQRGLKVPMKDSDAVIDLYQSSYYSQLLDPMKLINKNLHLNWIEQFENCLKSNAEDFTFFINHWNDSVRKEIFSRIDQRKKSLKHLTFLNFQRKRRIELKKPLKIDLHALGLRSRWIRVRPLKVTKKRRYLRPETLAGAILAENAQDERLNIGFCVLKQAFYGLIEWGKSSCMRGRYEVKKWAPGVGIGSGFETVFFLTERESSLWAGGLSEFQLSLGRSSWQSSTMHNKRRFHSLPAWGIGSNFFEAVQIKKNKF